MWKWHEVRIKRLQLQLKQISSAAVKLTVALSISSLPFSGAFKICLLFCHSYKEANWLWNLWNFKTDLKMLAIDGWQDGRARFQSWNISSQLPCEVKVNFHQFWFNVGSALFNVPKVPTWSLTDARLDGRLVLVPHNKEETPPLKCSVQLIKEFLCDTLMSLSSSRYALYLCLTCVVLVFFGHLSLTFDPSRDFTLWADSYKRALLLLPLAHGGGVAPRL